MSLPQPSVGRSSSMMISNFESHARRFLEPELSMQQRLQLATEVRDSIEIVHTSEYPNFLKCYFKVFHTVLTSLTKAQSVDGVDHKVRNVILEVLNRLPHTDILRPYVGDLVKLATHVSNSDNEENGLVCLRIIFDLHKNYRPTLEGDVPMFLEFVCKVYQGFKDTVAYFFEPSTDPQGNARPPVAPGQLNSSTRSFKVITECPLIVMFLFQLYPRFITSNIRVLLPLMIQTISVVGPKQVGPALKQAFVDFKAAQVKTLSFLTYLLRQFADYIRPHTDHISQSTVNLLVTCPDNHTIRKELLVATRHILATDFRRGFFSQVDKLLDEKVLVGTGRTCHETLRPLAYSLLAELIHHVRLELNLQQLSRIIYMFSRNMHDASLPISVQSTSVRLMLNLVETIFSRRSDPLSREEGRQLLGKILDAFVSKFGTIKRQVPYLLPPEAKEKAPPTGPGPSKEQKEGEDKGLEKVSLRAQLELPVQKAALHASPAEQTKELADVKQLTKTLIMGMKTLVWSITHFNRPNQPQNMVGVAPGVTSWGPKGMRDDELRITAGLLKTGVYCLALFREKDEEELYLHFAAVFTIMEQRNLVDLFCMCMGRLFDAMLQDSRLVSVFAAVLQNKDVSRSFADVLVHFLLETKLDLLEEPEATQAKLVLQLFRLLFVAVTKWPEDCQQVLKPHVAPLMETCLNRLVEKENVLGYLQLLRVVFRNLSGGRFEVLYRELIPTLHSCLSTLLAILDGPTSQDVGDLLVELCLTLPARLSSLLPHLPKLMQPLVLALKGSNELVALGLRTLEFWVDSLNPEFLEPSMANVMSDLILTLWSHLRPKPYPFGAKALQLLGKLGGRNRRFLKEPLELECKENPEHGLRVILTFEPTTSFLVPLDRCIYLACAQVMTPPASMEPYYRKHALQFLKVCLASVLNFRGHITTEGVTAGQLSTVLLTNCDPALRRSEGASMKVDLGVKTKTQLLAERGVFKTLLTAVISSYSMSELSDDDYVPSMCRHVAMLFAVEPAVQRPSAGVPTPGQALQGTAARGRGPTTNSKQAAQPNLKELDPVIFLDALVTVLGDKTRAYAEAALKCLNTFAETLVLLARTKRGGLPGQKAGAVPSTPMVVSSPSMNPVFSPPATVKIPVFEQLLPLLLHLCYGGTWQSQIGGVRGVGALVGKVPVDTLMLFQVKIVRALLHVLKRVPAHAKKEQDEASSVLTQVLRVVNNVVEDSNSPNNEQRRQSFQGVVEVLAAELLNAASPQVVRRTVQSCLSLLASRTGSEVSELLEPLHQPLLNSLLSSPLRAKPLELQVGSVLAINFCLSLRPPLLKMTPEVLQLLHDALTIAEADENVLQGKFLNPKMVSTLTKLRTVCIELLCTAMAWPDLRAAQHTELRARIITMFFKSLTCRTPDIVSVAKEGLRQVIQQQKLPKELLQSSLRPILVNLAHYKNLTMPLLQGLARLLELLSNWFNVTLGEKLMEHLKKWLEPEKLAQTAQKSWKQGEEPKIAAAILELFHLLPQAASKFLDPMLTLVIQLEQALPAGGVLSELNSPYRTPLTKFLNRYATEAVDYFLQRLPQQPYFTRFLDTIRSDSGQPLREELCRSADKIIQHAFQHLQQADELTSGPLAAAGAPADLTVGGSLTQQQQEIQFHGVTLVAALVKLQPSWLKENRAIFDVLLRLWRSPHRLMRLRSEERLTPQQVRESKRLVKCFLSFVRQDHSEVDVLFDMLNVFLVRTRVDFAFLREFYMLELPKSYTAVEKRRVFTRFLELFQSKAPQPPQLVQELLVVSLQLLVIPMLTHAFTHDQGMEVVDTNIIKTVVEHLLDPPDEISAEYDEPLRIELLQLATVLIRYLPKDLVHHRKELIKFGWNHLKREDSSSKPWAFVNVCHFLEAYQAPEKIILQVFVALLRTCQPESKQLVNEALDILMPALPARLPLGDQRIPIWIRYTKKILVEEGHSMAHLCHIFQLLVRHKELFYGSRAQFVPQMVNSLSRLGLPQNTPSENRRLAIDLAGLVVMWEKRRQEEAARGGPEPAPPAKAPVLEDSKMDDASEFSGGLKRSLSAVGLPLEASAPKRVKQEGSTAPAGAPSAGPSPMPATGSGSLAPVGGLPATPSGLSSGGPGVSDEEFKPNAAMEEMIVNFLIRVTFLSEPKDKEAKAMSERALSLLLEALALWPTASVKFTYMEKLLQQQEKVLQQQQQAAATVPAALLTGLDVLNVVMEKQPQAFLQANAPLIIQVMESTFQVRSADALTKLCKLFKKVFEAYPLEQQGLPAEVVAVHSKVEELIRRNLEAPTPAPPATESRNPVTGVTCALAMMRTVGELQRSYVDRFLQPLVRVVQRLAREMASQQASSSKTGNPVPEAAENSGDGFLEEGPCGDLKAAIRLTASRVLTSPEVRRMFISVVHVILQEKNTKSSVQLTLLDVVCGWVESTDARGTGVLNAKEIVAFLGRLVQVDGHGRSKKGQSEWNAKLLGLLYRLCTDAEHHPAALRQEMFQKVERTFMLGLRAQDPEMRKRFFALHHESIGKTLFHRLQYVIYGQEWESLSDCFWLKQGLDLLLATLVEQEPITLAPNSAQVPSLMVSGTSEKAVPGLPPQVPTIASGHAGVTVSDGGDEAPLTFQDVVVKHSAFLTRMAKLQVVDLVSSLSELASAEAHVAYHLWVLVFPIVWATLQKEEQVQLAKPMISLLSKEYHAKQLDKRPNVVQALLEGISLSQPQPKIPSELIKFLGKTYNAWHIAIPLLESHVMLFPQESRCFDALAELYRLLSEEDVLFGLWKRRLIAPETRAGLSLVQHGMWQKAQEVFYRAMTQFTQGSSQGSNSSAPSKAETCLWEEQWIACAKRLNQWELLADFGRSVENSDILLDTLWKLPDWTALKDAVLPKAQVEDSPRLRMVQAYVGLHDGSLSSLHDAELRCAQGIELALQRWWQLPDLSIQPHIPLLQQFQQLVELQESAKVLLEIGTASKAQMQLQAAGSSAQANPAQLANNYVELKDTLETWRLRLPNEWDDLTIWNDLLQWRNHMYNTVITAFKGFQETNPQLHQLGFRDKAWSVNKLAYVARKQGMGEVCVNVLNKMYGFLTMEVQEAFVKIREQAKAYLNMKGELRTGMNTINTTNLEYFPVQHKAEIFRLKGEFLQRMGDGDSANQAFSTAISLFKHLPKGWVSWGNYCDKVYKQQGEQLWLEYAVSCFLQGVKYGSAHGRSHLARVLNLLSFDNGEGTVGKAFDKYGDNIPYWVWLSWIPQLLVGLQRPEAPHCKAVLLKLAQAFPQALYYSLRTFLLEKREMVSSSSRSGSANARLLAERAAAAAAAEKPTLAAPGGSEPSSSGQTGPAGEGAGGPGNGGDAGGTSEAAGGDVNEQLSAQRRSQSQSAATAFELAKEVMEKLRTQHTNLATELEVMLSEIGGRFVPLPEERLLAVVHALLHRCYKYPTATTSEVPVHLRKELSGVCRACFSVDTVNKHTDFVQEYKRDFEKDLDPDNAAAFPASLAELTGRLKHWKSVLQSNVEDRLPSVLKLEEESRQLREFNCLEVEVPGQYLNDQEVVPESMVKLDRLGSDVPIVRRHGTSHRRLTLVGSDGSARQYLVQTSLTMSARSDERMVQLFRVLNRLLDKHKESRRRHLSFHTPIIVPVWPQVRLVEDEPTFTTFGEVYEINCARYGREADLPITHFKERLNQAISGQLAAEAVLELRHQTYSEITSQLVSENVFSQYMYKTLPTCNHLWTFKKQLAAQLALSGYMAYMLHIGGRAPNKILFAKNTGKVFQNDFHPTYDSNGMVECAEPVPFRLTRNLQTFFTPFGVEGLFVAAMCAAAQATVAPKLSIESQLAMFFRDELISWASRRPPHPAAAPNQAHSLTTPDLKAKVIANVDTVMARVKAIAPQTISEEESEQPVSLQRGVSELVNAALCPKNLCMMDPTWHPWF